MKSLFTLILVFGVIAQAKLACFKADKFVWGLPQEICLESVESGNGVLTMKGKNLNLVTSDYYMEEPDLHLMAASFKFVEFYETCGESLSSVLEARFRMSGSSVSNFPAMSIEVPYERTNDSCHSGWSRGVVKYSYYK